MKKVIYSALAIASAIAGVAASKANTNLHRLVTTFYFTTSVSPTTAALVTSKANWSTVIPAGVTCGTTTSKACSIVATYSITAGVAHHKIIRPSAVDAQINAETVTLGFYRVDAGAPGVGISNPLYKN